MEKHFSIRTSESHYASWTGYVCLVFDDMLVFRQNPTAFSMLCRSEITAAQFYEGISYLDDERSEFFAPPGARFFELSFGINWSNFTTNNIVDGFALVNWLYENRDKVLFCDIDGDID